MTLAGHLQAAGLVALGGGLGSLARWLVGLALPRQGFPYATLLVNLAGCFLIGALFAHFHARTESPELRLLLVTGVLGGFTTMSAFALEANALWTDGPFLKWAAYVGGTLAGCLAAVWAGRAAFAAWA